MPAGFSPFLLNPGWLDAAYMTYAWPDYFRSRPSALPQHSTLIKGKLHTINSLLEDGKPIRYPKLLEYLTINAF